MPDILTLFPERRRKTPETRKDMMMMVYVVNKGEELNCVFSSYQKAIAYIMMKMDVNKLIEGFKRSFGVDYYYFSDGTYYSIEECELDKGDKYE
jgi:hypothetical protein